MSPRKYDLGRRRGPAEATRLRILEAARALLGGRGDPAGFSMEAVADRAGVSRMTVYNQFHSEGGLLEALANHIASRGGMHQLREAFVEPDPAAAVSRFVTTFVEFWASERVLLRRLRAFGVLFPTLYKEIRERDAWRREAATNLVARLRGPPGGEPRNAEARVSLLYLMTGFEAFDALCDDQRPPAQVAQLLSEALLRCWGLAPPHRDGPAPAPPTPSRDRPRSPRPRPRNRSGAERGVR